MTSTPPPAARPPANAPVAPPDALRASFLAALGEPARAHFAALDADALDATLSTQVARAREAAELAVEASAVVASLAARLGGEPSSEGALAAVAALEAADLALADACARGEPVALRAFDARYGGDLDLAIGKSPGLGLGKDEFRQQFRAHVMVGEPGRAPRIAGYGGRGPLRAWVRVTATRLVIDLARRPEQPAPLGDELDALLPPTGDPETGYLRHAYGDHLAAAFADALAALTPRQRNLLRQKHLHELTGERLAAMYGVHRATVFGWIEDARKALLKHLGQALRARTAGHDLDSVLGAVGSRLDLSVRRLLDDHLEDDSR
jgi:RNA polymerase sigma-70 factor (ECF subfamily)